jgi:hypothetical protein
MEHGVFFDDILGKTVATSYGINWSYREDRCHPAHCRTL